MELERFTIKQIKSEFVTIVRSLEKLKLEMPKVLIDDKKMKIAKKYIENEIIYRKLFKKEQIQKEIEQLGLSGNFYNSTLIKYKEKQDKIENKSTFTINKIKDFFFKKEEILLKKN